MPTLDLLSIGDAMLDVFLSLNEADVRCDLKEDECVLCLPYADKIPVDRVTHVPGAGNASNNAVGASRLGMKTAIYSVLGNDDVATIIANYWKGEGVETTYVVHDDKRPTNYSTVLNYHGERTILLYHEHRDYEFPTNMAKAKWVYLTSMGEGSERIHPQLIEYLDKTKARFVFQPGTFQLRLGMRMLKQLIARAEIVIMNKDEAVALLKNGTKDIPTLLKEFCMVGCTTPIITDGRKGSYAYDGKDVLKMGIMDTPVVERTGCGDAFATALVAGLHYGKSLEEAMRWGTANSASVIETVGPQEGLLTKTKLNAMLRRFKDVQAEKL